MTEKDKEILVGIFDDAEDLVARHEEFYEEVLESLADRRYDEGRSAGIRSRQERRRLMAWDCSAPFDARGNLTHYANRIRSGYSVFDAAKWHDAETTFEFSYSTHDRDDDCGSCWRGWLTKCENCGGRMHAHFGDYTDTMSGSYYRESQREDCGESDTY